LIELICSLSAFQRAQQVVGLAISPQRRNLDIPPHKFAIAAPARTRTRAELLGTKLLKSSQQAQQGNFSKKSTPTERRLVGPGLDHIFQAKARCINFTGR
jgi:hypothetical protein